jgi:hypothetical protein
VDEAGQFYKAQDQPVGTYLALRWNGRVRYIVPRDAAGQKACWKLFHPGRLELPLRAMARMPRLLGAVSCVEADKLASIREAISKDAGLSCCRTGAPGVWSKDTILFLDHNAEPLYIVKAGAGEAVDFLLRNEANWLQTLHDQASLADHIPEIVAHRSGEDLSYVVERPLQGKFEYKLGESHFAFLRKLQEYSRQTMPLEESRLYQNLRSRLKDLNGLLSQAWSIRLEKAMQRIEQSLSGPTSLFVAAHNDFTPWNIRVQSGIARIFDWEYADYEQLPLFDPLHFALMPMALMRQSPDHLLRTMRQTLRQCKQRFAKQLCYEAETQALAYLVNLASLFLWADRGDCTQHPVVARYAHLIDYTSSDSWRI